MRPPPEPSPDDLLPLRLLHPYAEPSDHLVVVFPGMSGNLSQWSIIIDRLDATGVHVALAPTILPGPGVSDPNPTVESFAADIAKAAKSAGYSRITLLAHSVGSFVAFEIARLLPDEVNAILAVNGALYSVGRFLDRPWLEPMRRPRTSLTAMRLFVLAAVPTSERFRAYVRRNERVARLLVGRLVPPEAMATEEARAILMEGTNRPDILRGLWTNRHHWPAFAEHSREVRCPVVFAIGTLDPMNSPRDGQDFAEMFENARIVIMPGVGHAAPLESPDDIWELVVPLLATPAPGEVPSD